MLLLLQRLLFFLSMILTFITNYTIASIVTFKSVPQSRFMPTIPNPTYTRGLECYAPLQKPYTARAQISGALFHCLAAPYNISNSALLCIDAEGALFYCLAAPNGGSYLPSSRQLPVSKDPLTRTPFAYSIEILGHTVTHASHSFYPSTSIPSDQNKSDRFVSHVYVNKIYLPTSTPIVKNGHISFSTCNKDAMSYFKSGDIIHGTPPNIPIAVGAYATKPIKVGAIKFYAIPSPTVTASAIIFHAASNNTLYSSYNNNINASTHNNNHLNTTTNDYSNATTTASYNNLSNMNMDRIEWPICKNIKCIM